MTRASWELVSSSEIALVCLQPASETLAALVEPEGEAFALAVAWLVSAVEFVLVEPEEIEAVP